jgi:aminoglycoside/choline kinase family phosphotransferase
MHASDGDRSQSRRSRFQDAVYGSVTYDLVSLLRDAYIAWDEEHQLD